MWIDFQGIIHTEAIANPARVFAPDALRRVLSAPREQFDEAIVAAEAYALDLVEDVRSGMVDEFGEGEDAYVNVALPDDLEIADSNQLASLAAVLMEDLSKAPLRWRLDLVFAAVDALYELRPGRNAVLTWLSRRRILSRANLKMR